MHVQKVQTHIYTLHTYTHKHAHTHTHTHALPHTHFHNYVIVVAHAHELMRTVYAYKYILNIIIICYSKAFRAFIGNLVSYVMEQNLAITIAFSKL